MSSPKTKQNLLNLGWGQHPGMRGQHKTEWGVSMLRNIQYMHTRKSNIASIKAARDAGFEEWYHPEFRQIVMRWRKDSSL